MPHSIEPRDQVSVTGYGFLSFAENMGGSIGKNISKNLSSKHIKKLLDHAKQFSTDAFKTALKKQFKN